MADRVHALIQPLQPPCGQPAPDLSARQAALNQLRTCDDAVLGAGESGDLEVAGAFCTHTVLKAPGTAETANLSPPHPAAVREQPNGVWVRRKADITH